MANGKEAGPSVAFSALPACIPLPRHIPLESTDHNRDISGASSEIDTSQRLPSPRVHCEEEMFDTVAMGKSVDERMAQGGRDESVGGGQELRHASITNSEGNLLENTSLNDVAKSDGFDDEESPLSAKRFHLAADHGYTPPCGTSCSSSTASTVVAIEKRRRVDQDQFQTIAGESSECSTSMAWSHDDVSCPNNERPTKDGELNHQVAFSEYMRQPYGPDGYLSARTQGTKKPWCVLQRLDQLRTKKRRMLDCMVFRPMKLKKGTLMPK